MKNIPPPSAAYSSSVSSLAPAKVRELAPSADVVDLEPGGEAETRARADFLEGYTEAVGGSGLLPAPETTERLIRIFELEKAVYELRYELDNRPDWVGIPVAGIERLMQQAAEAL